MEDCNNLEEFDSRVSKTKGQPYLFILVAQPTIFQKVITAQQSDHEANIVHAELVKGEVMEEWSIDSCGDLRFVGKLFVLLDESHRKDIFSEDYKSKFIIYPDSTKMYQNLHRYLWWNGIKRDRG